MFCFLPWVSDGCRDDGQGKHEMLQVLNRQGNTLAHSISTVATWPKSGKIE
jgi:hypothetical protein